MIFLYLSLFLYLMRLTKSSSMLWSFFTAGMGIFGILEVYS
jgi:hypothetical protein